VTLTIGVDVGGTKVLAGVVDSDGKVIAKARRNTPREGGSALTKVIAEVANELKELHEVIGVGISTAGFISADRETMLANPNIANWSGVNLTAELRTLIGLPLVLENDANCAAWGEARFGAGIGEKHLVMLTIGTGVGGGLVIDGALYRGAFGIGAEFGHMRIVPDGLACGCGVRGCLEQYASGSALLRYAREEIERSPGSGKNLLARGDGTIAGLTGDAITQAARDGDRLALAAFTTLGHWLGEGIANVVAALDPACIIIGGGVIDAGEILLNPARENLLRYLPAADKRPHPRIIAALLGNEAGLVGVADLVRR